MKLLCSNYVFILIAAGHLIILRSPFAERVHNSSAEASNSRNGGLVQLSEMETFCCETVAANK